MTETMTKFVEKLGWKISNYSWDGNAHLYYVEEPDNLEIKFEELRLAFKKVSHLGNEKIFPMLKRAGDDLILVLIPQPSFDYVQSKTNLYLLIATIFSTTWAGALWWASYSDAAVLDQSNVWLRVLINPDVLLMGFLTYSLPLMAILGAHEMGHYYYARKHNLDASLPFFLPMPPMLFILGTMGAFISIREPIPNRKALLDVGASGPIAGLFIAIPVTLLGFWLTEQNAVPPPIDSGSSMYLGSSLFWEFMYIQFSTFLTPSGDYLSHPVVLAGWAGFFVTALNLMPAGQLDGGHIARSLLGPKSNGISLIVIMVLVFMAFYGIPGFVPYIGPVDNYYGWGVYALLILILGTSHPPPSEEISKLGKSRIGVGILTGLILVLTFIPSPLVFGESQFSIDITEDENHFAPVLGESNSTSLVILNNGKFDGWDNITLNLDKVENYTLTLEVEYVNVSESNKQFNSSSVDFSRYVHWDESGENLTINLTSKSYANLTLTITPIEEPKVGEISFDLRFTSRTERVYTRTFVLVTEAQS